MARLGFWWQVSRDMVAGVMLYPGSDWYTLSGERRLDPLPSEVAGRMLPEEIAAREAGELRVRIGGLAGLPEGIDYTPAIPQLWEVMKPSG